MILKSFLLGNPVSLCMKIFKCMKILNSVVVVGLYYGFLTTFSIGPSYLFLLRAWVMEEEEGTEKLVSATTGFIMGQLMMFISIYYAPLHLALDRPHTITVLALSYLLFHFFWETEIQCFEYTNRNRNSIRNFSVRHVFLNNLIFQLVNQFLLPSSTLARLVNVSMFRCDNKMLFVTSSFVGWLIGHIFFMKWVGLVLFWIRKMNFIWTRNSIGISPNKYILFCKYYASGLFLRSKDQLFVIILLITNIYYLGRIPPLALTRRAPESLEMRRWEQSTKKEKRDLVFCWFNMHIVNILFDYKQWNRPLRYIKNNNFEKPVIDEMSQYFFRIRPGYGEQSISLTFPPSLSTFWKMMQRKLKYWPRKRKREGPWEFYIDWVYTNSEKKRRMHRELVNRIRALSKGALVLDVLEKRTRLCECDNENKQKYLPKAYDPFLSGPYRQKKPKKGHTPRIYTEKNWLNPIICSILIVDFPELFDPKNRELAYRVIGRNTIIPEVVNQRRQAILAESREIGKKTISTKVPRWSRELGIDFQEEEEIMADDPTEYYPVLVRPYDRLVVYSENDPKINTNPKTDIERKKLEDQFNKEIALQQYTKETDVYRDLIQGSTLAQRRKAAILSPYQTSVRSPLFLDRTKRKLFPSFDISNIISNSKIVKTVFSFWVGKGPKFEVSTSDSKIKKDEEPTETRFLSRTNREAALSEKATERVQELFTELLQRGSWEVVLAMQGSRGLALLAQSNFRKYILLPSLVIAKNLVRVLFLRTPEWSADWEGWRKETHIKCTYSGVEISDTEFPNNWLNDGIQIRVLYPFYPKPWHRSKLRSRHRDPMKEKKRNADWENKRKREPKYENSFYLTAWGGAVARPFGRPIKRPCFFTPIWEKLKKRIRKEIKKPFSVLIRGLIRALIKRVPFLRTILGILKDKTRWIQNQKITSFFIKKIKEFEKKNPIFRKPNREKKKRVSQPQMPQKQNYIRILPARRNRGGVGVSKRKVLRFNNRYNNRMAFRDNPPATATNLTHSQIQMRKMYMKRRRIGGEIKKLQEELLDLLPTPDGNISETGLDAEKWEIRLSIWEILSGIGARLKHKLRLIIKYLFIERIYMDIFLSTINICRIYAQHLLELERKMIKYIQNMKKRIEERKRKKAAIAFISDFKESYSNITNEKSWTSWGLSSLSQAHVFYNLSQTQAIHINKYRSMSVLQDRGAHLFLRDRIKDHLQTLEMLDVKSSPISFKAFKKAFKDRIKDFLRTLGRILGVKSSPKRLTNFDKWRNWLIRDHYQYNLSQTRWSRLVSQKGRNKVSKRRTRTSQNKKSKKYSYKYKKGQFLYRDKQKKHAKTSLKSQKNKRYDLLSQKYIHYGDEKRLYLSFSVKRGLSLRGDLFFSNRRFFSDYRTFSDFLEKKTSGFVRKNWGFFIDKELKALSSIRFIERIKPETILISLIEKKTDNFIEKAMDRFIDEDLSNFLQEKINDLRKESISDRDLIEKKIRDFIEIEEGSIMNGDGDGDTRGRKYLKWEIILNSFDIKTQTDRDTGTNIHEDLFLWDRMKKTFFDSIESVEKATRLPLLGLPLEPPLKKMLEKVKKKIKTKVKIELQFYWFLPELAQLYIAYKQKGTYKGKPWIIPIQLLVSNYESFSKKKKEYLRQKESEKESQKISQKESEKESQKISQKERQKESQKKRQKKVKKKRQKISQKERQKERQKKVKKISQKKRQKERQKERQKISQKERQKISQKESEKKGENESEKDYIKRQKDNIEAYIRANYGKLSPFRISSKIRRAQLNLFLRRYFLFQLNVSPYVHVWSVRECSFVSKMAKNRKKLVICAIRLEDVSKGVMVASRRASKLFLQVPELLKAQVMIIDPIRLFRNLDGQSIMYQTISISLVHKNQHQTNQRCREKKYDLLVPDNIPSTRRRREFRIRVCLDSVDWDLEDSDPILVDEYNTSNCVCFLDGDKHIDTDRNNLIQFKLFLWPNYRLEDLACMNRYWFDIDNGSRFSTSRIHMYPRFRIS